jgi:hypothetical protein
MNFFQIFFIIFYINTSKSSKNTKKNINLMFFQHQCTFEKHQKTEATALNWSTKEGPKTIDCSGLSKVTGVK